MSQNKINDKSPYILTINQISDKNINQKKYINQIKKINYNKNFSPLSGSEHTYEPELWNKKYNVKNSHNCYSYALGNIVSGIKSKAQPGYASGFDHIGEYKCSSFFKRLKKDSPLTYQESFDKQCMPGFYKIFLALDKENDYHWYRQDNNKYWSHKPGYSDVVNIDANNKKIANPEIASRDYGYLNYKTPCFFACVNSDLTRSLDKIYEMN
jgi:hypothetical protein